MLPGAPSRRVHEVWVIPANAGAGGGGSSRFSGGRAVSGRAAVPWIGRGGVCPHRPSVKKAITGNALSDHRRSGLDSGLTALLLTGSILTRPICSSKNTNISAKLISPSTRKCCSAMGTLRLLRLLSRVGLAVWCCRRPGPTKPPANPPPIQNTFIYNLQCLLCPTSAQDGPAVRLSLLALRGHLVAMMLLLLYHVQDRGPSGFLRSGST